MLDLLSLMTDMRTSQTRWSCNRYEKLIWWGCSFPNVFLIVQLHHCPLMRHAGFILLYLIDEVLFSLMYFFRLNVITGGPVSLSIYLLKNYIRGDWNYQLYIFMCAILNISMKPNNLIIYLTFLFGIKIS